MKARAYVAGGHVFCRITRQDTDIEKCFACTRLRVLADEATPPFVVCETSGVTPDVEDERAYATWLHQHHRPGRAFPS